MTPEEQLAKILKQNQNIVFGKTIGTDADGNCTVQTGESSILARSGGQISAGDCVAMKADDGQWYAVSSRVTGTVDKKTLFKRKSVQIATAGGVVKILLLERKNVQKDGNSILIDSILIGGDRDTPEEIYVIPDGFGLEKAKISATGGGVDDWIVQIVIRKQVIIDAYAARETNSFLEYYHNNASTFVDSRKIVTITADDTKVIEDDGLLHAGGDTFQCVVTAQISFGCVNANADNGIFIFIVEETYSINTNTWIYTPISRVCNIFATWFKYTIPAVGVDLDFGLVNQIRSDLLAATKPVYLWKTFTDANVLNPYTDCTLNTSSSFLPIPIAGDWLLADPKIAGHGWFHRNYGVILKFHVSDKTEPSPSLTLYRENVGGFGIYREYIAGINSFPSSYVVRLPRAYVINLGIGFNGLTDDSFSPNSTNIYADNLPTLPSPVVSTIILSPSRDISNTITPTSSANDLPIMYPAKDIYGAITAVDFGILYEKKIDEFIQGLDFDTQLLRLNSSSYVLYRGVDSVNISASPITGTYQNLIDDVITQVLATADESVDKQEFQLLPTAQPDPETQTIDIESIADNGTVLSASAFQTS